MTESGYNFFFNRYQMVRAGGGEDVWEGIGVGGNNCDLRVRSELVENVNTASSRVNKPVRATTNTQSQRKIKQNVPAFNLLPTNPCDAEPAKERKEWTPGRRE